jgi:hypothetical protein
VATIRRKSQANKDNKSSLLLGEGGLLCCSHQLAGSCRANIVPLCPRKVSETKLEEIAFEHNISGGDRRVD